MTSGSTRRQFLEMTGAAVGMAGLGGGEASGLHASAVPEAATQPASAARPKVAALASVYYYLSHGYHIVGRFLDGFPVYDGARPCTARRSRSPACSSSRRPTRPTSAGPRRSTHGVRFSPTIADALTLGTGKLAVNAVLLIAEHGEYPYNEKLQKLYPRGQVLPGGPRRGPGLGPAGAGLHRQAPVVQPAGGPRDGRPGPSALGVPLMAGSSLPVTWRFPRARGPARPDLQRGAGRVAGRHRDLRLPRASRPLQCMVERRDRKGKPQGITAVTCLEGDAVWEAGDQRSSGRCEAARPRPRPQPLRQRGRHPAEHARLPPPGPAGGDTTPSSGTVPSPSSSSTSTDCAGPS